MHNVNVQYANLVNIKFSELLMVQKSQNSILVEYLPVW